MMIWTWISPAEEESKCRHSQNKQHLELAALKAGKSISKDATRVGDETKSLGHGLTAVIVRKGSVTK